MLGVLSALPLISSGNACCCLWLVTGGVVAAYVLQQNQPTPITPGDGALAGLLAAIVGAFVYLIVSIPVAILLAPFERRVIERLVDTIQNMPPEFRTFASNPLSIGLRTVVGFGFVLLLGVIFSTIGGVIGAAIFATQTPPPGVIDIRPGE